MKTKNIIYGFILTLLSTAFFACTKEAFDDNYELKRQFTPTSFKIEPKETQVKVTWSPSLFSTAGKISYTVQLSTDSLFQSEGIITKQTDTAGITLTEDDITVREKYFALIKANGENGTEDSRWVLSPSFRIPGEQIFSPILAADLKDKSILLKWRASPGITRIVLTPEGGSAREVVLLPEDITANEKLIASLTPSTRYTAEIFAATRSKGTITFTTKEPSIFTQVITPDDDMLAVITNAANGDVIGLEPGTYDYKDQVFLIFKKHLVIQSVSGNPANTKVIFKEFKLSGTGAGIKLSGIEFDGNNTADYFINLVGETSDGEAAVFTSITVDNSIVTNTKNCAIRGNRAANLAHKIDFIRFSNSIFKDNGGSYTYLTLAKMEFKKVEFINSTFTNIGRALIMWDTALTGVSTTPSVLIDQCTMANFGSRNHTILDANGNTINFTMQNSILVNLPQAASGTSLLRASGGSLVVTNSNLFNLTNGAVPPVAATFPNTVTQSNNEAIDLGWTLSTTDFTLPATTPLRTAGTTGGALGDPRWH